jgi:hypothetical protein
MLLLLVALILPTIPASAGPIILGGDDLDLHGYYISPSNYKGWLYIQKAVANMFTSNCITRSNNDGSIAALGCSNSAPYAFATSGDAGGAIHYAAGVALFKTVNYYKGAPAINAFFAALASGTVNPAMIYIPSSYYDAFGGVSMSEGAALALHAAEIKNFVNSGGGLMAHIDGPYTVGWLSTVLPGIIPSTTCNSYGATLTTLGHTAFPSLLNSDIDSSAGPCHQSFSGVLGGLSVLALDGSVPTNKNFIIGGGCGTSFGDTCISISNQSVTCINTNQTYNWSFCVTNNFTGEINYLSIPNPPAGVTFSKDILQLPVDLQPGQGTCVSLYFTNMSASTNICFTMGAHNTNFFLCCSINVCLALPPCCANVTNETLHAIRGQPNCYTYNLIFENTTTSTIQWVYLVPESSACMSFNRDIILLSPPLLPNQSRSIPTTVCLSSAATCSAPYCFLVALVNSNFVQCCSVPHCLPALPGPAGVATPADGSVFVTPVNIPMTATLDTNFPLSAVFYMANGQVVATSYTPPFSAVWSNAPAGHYSVNVSAVDANLGGVWVSDSVNIYVLDPTQDTNALPVVPPILTSLKCVNSSLTFCLPSTAGVTYYIETTLSLTSPHWTVVQTVVGNGSTITLSNTVTATPQQFYRVRVQ